MSIWQQLGAFVQNVSNLSDGHLDGFSGCGGKWIIPVLLNDGEAAVNESLLPSLKARAGTRGLTVGGWFNGAGDDPEDDAKTISAIVRLNDLSPVVLDLELPYKAPNEAKMPALLKALRRQLPDAQIGVSSYGFADRMMIWNGRTLNPPQSFWDLQIRFLPQWYWPYSGRYSPEWCMADLKQNGATDENLKDSSGPKGRGIPLSYVHGTFESTGVEEGDLAEALRRLKLARPYGFTTGFSIYLLERTLAEDFARLKAVKGDLFI